MVTVIIPNYNHEPYLKERMETVLNQKFNVSEYIILDDASTDKSVSILNEYANQDNRIQFYPSDKNSGNTFIQWNRGVYFAKGKYIWIAESDDKADLILLRELIKPLENDPDVVLAYSQSFRMNAVDEINGTWKTFTDDLDKSLFENDFVMDGKEFIERFLIKKNVIPNASAVLFRKSMYEKIGSASENLKTNSDWLCWLKMLCYGKIAFISKPLNYFRYHSSSVIAKAHQYSNELKYQDQYDYTMRNEFISFVGKNQLNLSPAIKNINASFMAKDKGNKGLFLIEQGKYIKGWQQIIAASFYPTFQSGFIKRGFKIG